MRLFIAAGLPASLLSALPALQRRLRARTERCSLTKPENFHLTLRFLGETEPPVAKRLCCLIRGLSPLPPLHAEVEGTGWFSTPDGLTVFVGLKPSRELLECKKKVDLLLEQEGISRERRPWTPHITLARRARLTPGKQEWLEGALDPLLPKYKLLLPKICLFSSSFTPNGMRYEILAACDTLSGREEKEYNK